MSVHESIFPTDELFCSERIESLPFSHYYSATNSSLASRLLAPELAPWHSSHVNPIPFQRRFDGAGEALKQWMTNLSNESMSRTGNKTRDGC